MDRLLPARPPLARWRRHIEMLPHGLPTALTFTISVAAFLFGSMLVVGSALPSGPRSDADQAIAAPGDPTPTQPSARPATQTPATADVPTAVASPRQRPASTATARAAVGSGQSATHDGRQDKVADDGAGSGSTAASGGSDRPDDGSASSREPGSEDAHDAPVPSNTPRPERDRHAPEPSPTSTPEPEPE
jgi:hypothetical protein